MAAMYIYNHDSISTFQEIMQHPEQQSGYQTNDCLFRITCKPIYGVYWHIVRQAPVYLKTRIVAVKLVMRLLLLN